MTVQTIIELPVMIVNVEETMNNYSIDVDFISNEQVDLVTEQSLSNHWTTSSHTLPTANRIEICFNFICQS